MWKDTLRIAGAYVAYVIGSGFATGQEIVQFFTVYGIKGIAGMLVCTVLFAAMGSTLLAEPDLGTEMVRYQSCKTADIKKEL